MKIHGVLVLAFALAASQRFALPNSFAQNFVGTIGTSGNIDGIGLGAPFDGSENGQAFSGSFVASDLTISGPSSTSGTLTSYSASGPSTLTLNFPTQSFVESGTAYINFVFSVPSTPSPDVLYEVQVIVALQPTPGSGPYYGLDLEADASMPFFASATPDALPVTLDKSVAGAEIFGGFSISAVRGYSSATSFLLSSLSPDAVVPEPETWGLAAMSLTGLLWLSYLKYRRTSLVLDIARTSRNAETIPLFHKADEAIFGDADRVKE